MTTQTSELHDPKSAYFDPSLTVEASEERTARSYFGFGASDLDRRAPESLDEAWAVIGAWVVGDNPASVIAIPEVLGKVAEQFDIDEGIRPDPAYRTVGEAILRDSVLMPTASKPDRPGLGSVTMNFDPDLGPISNWNEDPLDPIFFPVVSFSVADENGLLNHPYAAELLKVGGGSVAAFAQVYVPQSVRTVPARRVGGRIVAASQEGSLWPVRSESPSGAVEWLPGAAMHGIVRVYTLVEQAQADLASLRAAVKAVRVAQRASSGSPDVLPEADQPRRKRRA